ncbi:uncharacterized protein LOC110096740 [Dendrobium catenatum]|uniref:uncharacterized protein LOC110096740 n=1 Tax=Dendrobium catenatum TaxID=906689 RepID=UPI00109FBF08|nr:uncharacterized protein LOC110096740 [Dendrobium catenatum]
MVPRRYIQSSFVFKIAALRRLTAGSFNKAVNEAGMSGLIRDDKERFISAFGEGGQLSLRLTDIRDLGNGRWRCDETGHDLPGNEKESYSHTKACRVALIDAALAKKKPILNTFQPHPISKSMLVCSLTGDVINKSEQHIWKHINGRRFLKKLGIFSFFTENLFLDGIK